MSSNLKTTTKKVYDFETIEKVFKHLAKELKALGMKKPSDTLSVSKVRFINRMLGDIRSFMSDEPQVRYLDLLDEDALPQYSDAILILSQYEGALSGFEQRYSYYSISEGTRAWRTEK